MRGALVFIAVFVIVLVVSLGAQDLPPGRQIYDAVVGAETDYPILGIEATTLIIASFNGIIYGVVAWVIYTFIDKARKSPKEQTQAATETST